MGEGSIYLGDTNHLTVKASYTVEMHDKLALLQPGKRPVELDVTILANFEKIPPEMHNTFIQMLSIKYGSTLNCYNNPEPFAIKKKKKWWQIWK